MDKRFLSNRDVRSRLHGSVVRYKGKPVSIRCNEESNQVVANDLRTGGQETVSANSRHLDSSSPPIGFVNIDGCAVYAVRYPHRRYKAGLTDENVTATPINAGTPRMGSLVHSSEMADTIDGVYPSFEDALATAKRGNACAFTRHLAVDNKGRIWCGTNRLGVMRKGRFITLKNHPKKLIREIEELTKVKVKHVGHTNRRTSTSPF